MSCKLCFNSTLVRLKAVSGSMPSSIIRFQYHTGSIKSVAGCLQQRNAHLFQYHTGSIKSGDMEKPGKGCAGFNSTLVRLKASPCLPAPSVAPHRFNSTLVRLKATFHVKRSAPAAFSFNSTLVRLKAAPAPPLHFPV